MTRPLPDLSAPDWTPRLAGLLERASGAIGRLDARISVTSSRSAWLDRASWIGFAEARRGQGAEIEEIDVFGLATGTVLPQRRRLAFADDELAALTSWRTDLTKADAPHGRELIPMTLDFPSDWGERPALLRALELTAQHARADRAAAAWLGMPALLKALGVTRTPLPCLVAADKALRLAPRDRDAIIARYLKALARSAEAGLERLDGVETERIRAAHAVARVLRSGKLLDLALLLQRRPVLTPLGVARTLRLSLSGAGKLLARAADSSLVVEISGRRAWRAYLVPDLAITYGFKRRPAGRPTASPILPPLNATLAAFDAEMAAFAARYPDIAEASASDRAGE